jgi:hypothetical protein
MTIRSLALTMGIAVLSAVLLMLWVDRTDACEYIGWLAPLPKNPRVEFPSAPAAAVIDYPFGKCDRSAPLFLAAFLGLPVLFLVGQGALIAWLNRRRPVLIAVLAAGVVAVLFRVLLIPARDGHYGFGVLYIMVACAILWAFIALPVGVGAVLAKRRMKAHWAAKAQQLPP